MIAVKKVRKFQGFFAQISKFSAQISKFKLESQISWHWHSRASYIHRKTKISMIPCISRSLVGLNFNPPKSLKQMKFSCVNLRKFQGHLPYSFFLLCKFLWNRKLLIMLCHNKRWNGISGLNGRALAFCAKGPGFNPRPCLIFEALFPFHRSSYEARFVCWV